MTTEQGQGPLLLALDYLHFTIRYTRVGGVFWDDDVGCSPERSVDIIFSSLSSMFFIPLFSFLGQSDTTVFMD